MWAACLALLILVACSPSSRPSGPRVAVRDVTFQSAGYRLEGSITSPEPRPATAGVLILGGSGPIDRDGASRVASTPPVYRWWAEALAEAGFVVLRYDKRFLTHPSIDLAAFDQEAQIADALAALSFLRRAPEVAGRDLFVMGHSEGGTLAPIVALRNSAVAGLVLVNTVVFPVDELVVAQLDSSPTVPKAAVADARNQLARIKAGSFPPSGLLLGAGAGYWRQWIEYSTGAPARLSNSPAPLLVVQCLSDQTLPGGTLDRNLSILRATVARNKSAQLRELAGHDHFTMQPGAAAPSHEFMQIVLRWLRQALTRT